MPSPHLWQLECQSITSHSQTDPPIEDFESGENGSKALSYFKIWGISGRSVKQLVLGTVLTEQLPKQELVSSCSLSSFLPHPGCAGFYQFIKHPRKLKSLKAIKKYKNTKITFPIHFLGRLITTYPWTQPNNGYDFPTILFRFS